jgi:hypothetical protein
LPIVILGGEHGHVPLEPSGGEVVAKLVVEERVSTLLDLSMFRKHEVATFMADYLESLYRMKAAERFRTPLMLILDEADAIAPQKPMPNEMRIVRRGGQRGLGCTVITQRSAVLNKNVLTQAQMLVALRTIGPQDLSAINAWIDVHGTPEERKTLMESLPSLPVGDAWVWSPGWPTDAGIFKRIHTLPIETFDSGATPKPGEKRLEPKRVADVYLDAVRAQMAATLERAKADDPREHRKRVAQLEKQVQTKLEATPPPAPREVEKPILTAADRQQLERVAIATEKLGVRVHELLTLVSEKAMSAPPPIRQHPTSRSTLVPAVSPSKPQRSQKTEGSSRVLGEGERKVLTAAAQHAHGVTREQLTILTGYKRSTRDAYIQRLRNKGFLHDASGGLLTATETGLLGLGADYQPLPTGDALLRYGLHRLPEGESAILELIVARHPSAVTRDTISALTSYKRSTRDAYLQRLAVRKLIKSSRGGFTASDDVFD